jgi:hypothetical protein
MFQRKLEKVAKRLLWRMSSTDLAGVYFTAGRRVPTARAAPLEVYERGFRGSAFELSSGAEVIETAMDSQSVEFLDPFSTTQPLPLA